MADVDEQAFAESLPARVRAERGAFFTPVEIVDRVLRLVDPLLTEFGPHRPLAVVDPACGAGAFLVGAHRHWPGAHLFGVDLERSSLDQCIARLPSAQLVHGNSLSDEQVLDRLERPAHGITAFIGNPPYNGTSSLLRSPEAWARAQKWLPDDVAVPRGTSLRDDYIFFLLRASKWLEGRDGVLAFVTSSTLLDAFQHSPVREALLRRLSLRHVVDLGEGAFRGTRVRTCITVWSTRPRVAGPGEFTPAAPEFALRPPDPEAEALDAQWRANGVPLTILIPISFSGLKTRFDELLVDDEAARLLARLHEFARCSVDALGSFAEKHGLPLSTMPKLVALHPVAASLTIDEKNVRPFHRYRGPLPMGAPAFCYLERLLIPRGDHRFRGDYDPHAEPVKLVFNINELPLAAKVIDTPGCVTAYRHSRFAPLNVPRRILEAGLGVTRGHAALGALAPNLRQPVSDPRKAFERIAAFINSEPVQNVWAPAFGTRRILPLPASVLDD